MNTRIETFNQKNPQSHPCGKKSIFDIFRKKVFIKDLEGKILYEGRGSFGRALENAVKEGVALPKADLRNQDLRGRNLKNGKFTEASFEGSDLGMSLRYKYALTTSLVNADLTGAKLGNTKLYAVDMENANVAKADFGNQDLRDYPNVIANFEKIRNLDKAVNVVSENLKEWQQDQKESKLINAIKATNSR